jgi:hypothetical protein
MPDAADPFRNTDRLESSALDLMATRFEARGRHPYFATALSAYLDRMEIDRRSAVVDLGCGTGIAARAIASRAAFAGSVLGIAKPTRSWPRVRACCPKPSGRRGATSSSRRKREATSSARASTTRT